MSGRREPARTRSIGGDPTLQVSEYRAPADCPVCGDHLSVTRLGCESCGSELSGIFAPCSYCALDDADSELLRVFLVSRGNMREVEKHLGVSYPTARARYASMLDKLGLSPQAPEPAAAADDDTTSERGPAEDPDDTADPVDRDRILADVATGRLTPAEAQELISQLL